MAGSRARWHINRHSWRSHWKSAADETELAKILAHLPTNGTVSPNNLNLALWNYFGAFPLVRSKVDGLGRSKILFTLPHSLDPNSASFLPAEVIRKRGAGLRRTHADDFA